VVAVTHCPEPIIEWPEPCTIEAVTAEQLFDDQEPWYVASALQTAAMALTAQCHVQDDHPVSWGAPIIAARCFDQIRTGILTQSSIFGSGCFTPKDYLWETRVTWKDGRHTTQDISAEIERLRRQLTSTACCLLAGFDIRRRIHIAGIDNTPDEAGPQARITIETTTTP